MRSLPSIPAFAAGALTTLIGVGLVVMLENNNLSKAQLWGKYWETRMAYEYALSDDIENHRHDSGRYAEENGKYFKDLVDRHILVPVTYPWRNPDGLAEFDRAIARVPTYRWGTALEGGQWPVGLEYIDEFSLPFFPKKFLGKR